MPIARRRASTSWKGSVTEGAGEVTLVTSGAGGPFPITLATRAADVDRSQTNPEELIAAAHSGCYATALANVLTQLGTPPETLDVKAVVTLDKVGEGFGITASDLTVTGVVPGLDQAGFEAATQTAEAACPVSNALRNNVTIGLQAALES